MRIDWKEWSGFTARGSWQAHIGKGLLVLVVLAWRVGLCGPRDVDLGLSNLPEPMMPEQDKEQCHFPYSLQIRLKFSYCYYHHSTSTLQLTAPMNCL